MAVIVYNPTVARYLAHLFAPGPSGEPKRQKGTKKARARKVFRFSIFRRKYREGMRSYPGRRHKK